jgi:LytS/YehU family sensor histidine kinase
LLSILLLSILNPFTIFQVDSAWNNGDVAVAHRNSRSARGWNIAAIIGGIVSGVVIGVLAGVFNSLRFIYTT